MNENNRVIILRDYMERADGWGHEEGRKVFNALLAAVEKTPAIRIFRISLDGVKRTDASFPRESVVELARRYRGIKGFCLTKISNKDLLDNWDAAALKKEQPLMVWSEDQYQVIGPRPSAGNREIFELAVNRGKLTASAAVKELGIKITNASNKLKQLEVKGFLLRADDIAESGGKEFVYFSIK
ncbi:MAG: DNA-binding protein [Deltaproteobacteria bacterium]|nr:DNA-binding protein [Deltaproteobacteria bacterium]